MNETVANTNLEPLDMSLFGGARKRNLISPVENKAKIMGCFKRFIFDHLVCIKRAQYSLIFVACAVVLFFQVAKCADKYLAKSTGTADKYVHVSKTAFPELTICPTYPYKIDVLQANGIATRNELTFESKWISNQSDKSPKEFYDEIVINIADIVHSVTIYVEALLDGKNIIVLNPEDSFCGETLFSKKEYYFNGDCFATILPKCIKDAGPIEIVFEFHDKTDVFIHHKSQFLSPNSKSRVDVDKGHFVKIAINHEVVQLLSGKAFGNCVDEYKYEGGFDGCMYSKMYQLMMESVGCTVPWLPNKSNICKESSKREAAFEIYQQNRRNQKDICPNSCLFTNMHFGPTVTGLNGSDRKDFGWAVFYFQRDIKTTREYVLYTMLSMVAEVGGYVGLLLGASLVNLGQINSFLLDLCFHKDAENDQDQA